MLTRTEEYDSVSESAYRRIRTDIVFGKLLPGERLKLERLRENYGASVGTLRELLARLATEGLVVAEGQRGFEVASVSAENLREIAALRLLLESHALDQSFRAGDMDWGGRVGSPSRSAPATWGGGASSPRPNTSFRRAKSVSPPAPAPMPKPGSAT